MWWSKGSFLQGWSCWALEGAAQGITTPGGVQGMTERGTQCVLIWLIGWELVGFELFEVFSKTNVLGWWQVGPWLCVEGVEFGGNTDCCW